MSETVTVFINGLRVDVRAGATVLDGLRAYSEGGG